MNSCVFLLAGTAAGGAYAYEKVGENADYFERTDKEAWGIIQSYIASQRGKLLYSSQPEGLIKVEFSKSLTARFEVQKVTKKTCYVKIDVWDRLLPNQELSQKYFIELSEKLK